MIEDLKQAEGLLEEALLTRSERYKLIQDMTTSANSTTGIMTGIKKLNSQIKNRKLYERKLILKKKSYNQS